MIKNENIKEPTPIQVSKFSLELKEALKSNESEENIADSASNYSNSIPFEFVNVNDDEEFRNLESKLQTTSSISRSSSPPPTDSSQIINELNLKLEAMTKDYKKLENENKLLHSKLLKKKSSM